MKRSIWIGLTLVVFALPYRTLACTNFLVTRGASVDGSTMITYSADSHYLYGELYHWPAALCSVHIKYMNEIRRYLEKYLRHYKPIR